MKCSNISHFSLIISIGIVDLGVIYIYGLLSQGFILVSILIYFMCNIIITQMRESTRKRLNNSPDGMVVTKPIGIGCAWLANIVFALSMGWAISEQFNFNYQIYDLAEMTISFLIFLITILIYYVFLIIFGKYYHIEMQFSVFDPFKKGDGTN